MLCTMSNILLVLCTPLCNDKVWLKYSCVPRTWHQEQSLSCYQHILTEPTTPHIQYKPVHVLVTCIENIFFFFMFIFCFVKTHQTNVFISGMPKSPVDYLKKQIYCYASITLAPPLEEFGIYHQAKKNIIY